MKNTILTGLVLLFLSFPLFVAAQNTSKVYQFGQPEALGVNSEGFDELLPVISPDGNALFFAKRNHPKNATGISDLIDIWYSKKEGDGWKKARPKKTWFNNYGYNFVSSISGDGKTLILGNTYKVGGSMEPGPSMSTWNGYSWSFPEKLNIEGFKNVSKAYNFNLSRDGKVLLMSINKEGTVGGRDLFVSFKKDKNAWSAPKNLGSVLNTGNEEVTPYLAKDNETLFFSSNGHGGEGDLDVFVTKRLDDSWTNWTKPRNLGKVINTNKSEAYFILNNEEKRCYYTQGESTGNGDIFTTNVSEEEMKQMVPEAEPIVEKKAEPVVEEVVVEKKIVYTQVSGTVTDKKTGDPLKAKVYVQGDGMENKKVNTDDNGRFELSLLPNRSYTLTPRASDHVTESFTLDVPEAGETVNKNLSLAPIEHGKVINLDHVYFDTGKSTIRSESYPELDHAYKVLSSYEGVEIVVSGHTDNTGNVDYNRNLSKKRAQAVVDYLVKKGFDRYHASSIGYGPDKPIADNSTNEGRQQNRRVEILIK